MTHNEQKQLPSSVPSTDHNGSSIVSSNDHEGQALHEESNDSPQSVSVSHSQDSSIHEEGSHEVDSDAPIHLPQEILQKFEQYSQHEEKLEHVLQFMQECLSKGGAHHFREFWEARKYALKVFKEALNATSRVHLWAKYSDLCREARRMKETFDEQSAFVAEQIEIAIQAVEDELKALSEKLTAQQPIEEIAQSLTLRHNLDHYNTLQNELNYLNVFATRLSSLKKELIKAEIRLKVKNKLFQHLARVGDVLFPRRKELIGTVSDLFRRDVEAFIQSTFVRDLKTPELFEAREEVKRLQHIAKLLTLNTEVFSTTREELSQCWDTIRDVVKERKKAQAEHKVHMRQHRDELMTEIQKIKESFEKKEVSAIQASKLLKGVSIKMKAVVLHHHDVQILKGEIKAVEQLIHDASEAERFEKREKQNQGEAERLRKIDELRENLHRDLNAITSSENDASFKEKSETLRLKIEETNRLMASMKLSKQDRVEFEKLIDDARHKISLERQEKLIKLASTESNISSTSDVYQMLLKEIEDLEGERAELKSRLESLKRSRGASGNDFSQAMILNESIEEAKTQLEEIESSLQALHDKIGL